MVLRIWDDLPISAYKGTSAQSLRQSAHDFSGVKKLLGLLASILKIFEVTTIFYEEVNQAEHYGQLNHDVGAEDRLDCVRHVRDLHPHRSMPLNPPRS